MFAFTRVAAVKGDILAAQPTEMESQANSGDISPMENLPADRESRPSSAAPATEGEGAAVSHDAASPSADESGVDEVSPLIASGLDKTASNERRRSVSFCAAPPKVIEFVR